MTKQTQSNKGKEALDQTETLKDEYLDQVNGGYTKVEWTIKKPEQNAKLAN